MFLKIPAYKIIDFDMLKFAEHVLDTSPAIASRSASRPVMKAIEAIAEAEDVVVEMTAEVTKALQAATEVAPTPPLFLQPLDALRQPVGEPQPVPRRAFEPFYAAIENMTTERPVIEEKPVSEPEVMLETEATEPLPVAAE